MDIENLVDMKNETQHRANIGGWFRLWYSTRRPGDTNSSDSLVFINTNSSDSLVFIIEVLIFCVTILKMTVNSLLRATDMGGNFSMTLLLLDNLKFRWEFEVLLPYLFHIYTPVWRKATFNAQRHFS